MPRDLSVSILALVLSSMWIAPLGCKNDAPVALTAKNDGGTAVVVDVPIAEKRRLTLGTVGEPDTLNPLFSEMAAATEVILLCHRELTMLNERWEVIPDLAVDIPSVENGGVKLKPRADKKTAMEVTWKIHPDATWEDGVPVTADDFIYAWEIQMDPSQEIIDRDLPERIEKMESRGDDKKTLVVTWKEPFAFYAQFQNHYAVPAHHLRPRVEKPEGGRINIKKDPSGKEPLCNGPFKLKEWQPGEYLIFEKNPHAMRAPKLDEIVVRIMTSSSIETALLAGDIDAVTPQGGLTVRAVEDFRGRVGDKFQIHVVPGLVWAHIDFNLDDALLKDKRLRHAIAHAVDRQGIIDRLYGGKLTLSHTYLPPRHWGYAADVTMYAFDPALANKMLDDAGFKVGKDGVRVDGKGRRLSFSIAAISGVKDVEDLELVVQANLKDVGIELTLDNKPQKAFFSEFARYRKFPHLSFYAWVMDPTTFGNVMWQEDMIPTKKNAWKGQNYPGWRNKEATKILTRVPVEIDEAKRIDMLRRVQELWAADLPSLPMYFRPVVAVTRPEVTNFLPTGTQTPVTWNAHEWDVTDRAP